jgi:hypothetical protein
MMNGSHAADMAIAGNMRTDTRKEENHSNLTIDPAMEIQAVIIGNPVTSTGREEISTDREETSTGREEATTGKEETSTGRNRITTV